MSGWIWAKLKTCGISHKWVLKEIWTPPHLVLVRCGYGSSSQSDVQTALLLVLLMANTWSPAPFQRGRRRKTQSFVISCQWFSEPQEIQSHPISPHVYGKAPQSSQSKWTFCNTHLPVNHIIWMKLFKHMAVHRALSASVNSWGSKCPQNEVHQLFKCLRFVPTTELRVPHLKNWINMQHDVIS